MSRSRSVSSLIDLSDSVRETVELLCERSEVGAELDLDRVPVSVAYDRVVGRTPRLLTGGEDYALLCTVSPSVSTAFLRETGLTLIGRVVSPRKKISWRWKDKVITPPVDFSHCR